MLTIELLDSRWLRGDGNVKGFVCRDDHKLDCVGFLLAHFGVDVLLFEDKRSASELGRFVPKELSFLLMMTDGDGIYDDSVLASELMDINDEELINDEQRLQQLNTQLNKMEINVVLV